MLLKDFIIYIQLTLTGSRHLMKVQFSGRSKWGGVVLNVLSIAQYLVDCIYSLAAIVRMFALHTDVLDCCALAAIVIGEVKDKSIDIRKWMHGGDKLLRSLGVHRQ
jgi:hypothetical protein